ncbi:MAG: chemotaxis protein CheA [Lachnospiraceae bacterium]
MDVSQYMDIFIDETKEHLQNLNDCIMILEKEPENKDTINEVFRSAHSLKGMAGTMGFTRMQHLTHDMEDVFQEIRSEKLKVNSTMIDILFECLDALEHYMETIIETSDEGSEDNDAIIRQLNNFLKGEADVTSDILVQDTESTTTDSNDVPEATMQMNVRFDELEFTDSERDEILSAFETGHNVYGIVVQIQQECLLKAARAFLVFKAVEDFGHIVAYRPSSQDIEDENFEFEFTFLLASEADPEPIIKAVSSVSEIEHVLLDKLEESILPEKEKEIVVETREADTKEKPEKEKKTTTKKAAVNKPVTNRTVRVDIEKLDALMNQVSELIIAKNSLVSISGSDDTSIESQGFHEQIEYLERITTNLHESVMKVRMVPIESVVNKFPRMIRDLSRSLGKSMELYMSGEDTELDRTVVDQIGDPLQHLLRNSADHGLENPEIRKERKKPEIGAIYLNAFQEGNNVIIEVSDDGNGIDTEKVREKAIERGVITQEQAESMGQKEIIQLLFLPSFSMAKTITDISGRGVGLDVVRSNIETLGGDVEVSSTLGEGSKFTVRLPLTLAIIQALMVEISDEKYAIALGSIQNIEDIPVSEIKYVQAKEVIHLRGLVIPLIRMADLLDIPKTEEEPESLTVVIVKKGDRYAGLVVDRLMGQQEIVIKSLGKFINNQNKIISGATILGDGEVALILDVNALI